MKYWLKYLKISIIWNIVDMDWPSVRLSVPAVHADEGGARGVEVAEEGGVVRKDVRHLRVLAGVEQKPSWKHHDDISNFTGWPVRIV